MRHVGVEEDDVLAGDDVCGVSEGVRAGDVHGGEGDGEENEEG